MSNIKTIAQEFTILGVTVVAQVPATATDWDVIKGDGSCVREAVSNHGYRGYASPVRTAILKALESAGHVAEEGEKDAAFIERLKTDGVDVETIASGAANAVDFVETMKGGNRADVGKDYIEQAQSVIAKIESGKTTLDTFLAKMRTLVPGAAVSDASDVTAIARVIRSFRKKQAEADLG